MKRLILIRHGQSIWNAENKFTGWVDTPLSEQGIREAKKAGNLIKQNNINIDIAFTSYLSRAIDTLNILLGEIKDNNFGTKHIGLTGGEPFMNPFILDILDYLLKQKFKVLVLSNGMRPIQLKFKNLLNLSNKKILYSMN